MALGALTIAGIQGEKPSAPQFVIDLSFAGDGAYPTGGTLDFEATVNAAIAAAAALTTDHNVRAGQVVAIRAIVAFECGQYVPWYDKTNDTLFVRDGGHATWDEVANGTNLAGTTFNLTLLCE